jgi:hypothetical protein
LSVYLLLIYLFHFSFFVCPLGLTKQKDEPDDEEEWNVPMASGTCLSLIANISKGNFILFCLSLIANISNCLFFILVYLFYFILFYFTSFYFIVV